MTVQEAECSSDCLNEHKTESDDDESSLSDSDNGSSELGSCDDRVSTESISAENICSSKTSDHE